MPRRKVRWKAAPCASIDWHFVPPRFARLPRNSKTRQAFVTQPCNSLYYQCLSFHIHIPPTLTPAHIVRGPSYHPPCLFTLAFLSMKETQTGGETVGYIVTPSRLTPCLSLRVPLGIQWWKRKEIKLLGHILRCRILIRVVNSIICFLDDNIMLYSRSTVLFTAVLKHSTS